MVLEDDPDVRRLLADPIDTSAAPGSDWAALVGELDELGLLSPELGPLLRDAPTPRVAAGRAHLALVHGDAAGVVRDRRRAATVLVRAHGWGAGDLADTACALLSDADVATSRRLTDEKPPTTALLVSVGETPRDLADDLLLAELPHLHLRIVEGDVVLGPYVAPRRTACLRCIDAHLSATDPAWPLLAAQHAEREAAERRDGAPEPVDPVAAHLGVAAAVQDLLLDIDGGAPVSWSATWRPAEPDPAAGRRFWLRHPGCACCWEWTGTMT